MKNFILRFNIKSRSTPSSSIVTTSDSKAVATKYSGKAKNTISSPKIGRQLHKTTLRTPLASSSTLPTQDYQVSRDALFAPIHVRHISTPSTSADLAENSKKF